MAMALSGSRPRGRATMGRARGYAAWSKTEVVRPGEDRNAARSPSDESSIVSAIKNLDLGRGDGVQIDNIIMQVKASAQQKEVMQKAADSVYDKCLEDTDFIPTGSKLCSKLAILEVDGVKYFRQFIMGRLQKDFQERETLRNKSCFSNRVQFLCRVFQDMRSPDGSPYIVLVAGICEYLKMLVSTTSSLEECKLFNSLLLSVGKEIDSVDSEKITSVLMEVRSRIVDASTSRPHRALLLHSLELAARKWELLPANVELYYKSHV